MIGYISAVETLSLPPEMYTFCLLSLLKTDIDGFHRLLLRLRIGEFNRVDVKNAVEEMMTTLTESSAELSVLAESLTKLSDDLI